MQTIKTSAIVSEGNIRLDLDDIAPLAGSIKAQGLLQPIGVSPRKDGTFKLEFGHRRFAACKLLGWKEIPAVEVKPTTTPQDRVMRQVVENVQRANVSIYELGIAFATAKEAGTSVADMAARTGLTDKFIHAAIKVATVDEVAASKVRALEDDQRAKAAKADKSYTGVPQSEWIALATFRGAEAQRDAADRLVAGHSLRAERSKKAKGEKTAAAPKPTMGSLAIAALRKAGGATANAAADILAWALEAEAECPAVIRQALEADGYVLDEGEWYVKGSAPSDA